MRRIISRFPHATRGILYALKNDSSFQSQFYGGLLFLFLVWVIFSPLAAWEWLFIILCWALILITELQNSALEEALDKIHPELNENIGRSKDMAAGAVLLAVAYTLATIVALSLIRLVS
jgi:diacylglycerol kinase